MTCTETQEGLSAFIDGDSSPEKCGPLFAHIAECKECRTFLQSSVIVRGMIARIPDPAVPPRLDARVLAIGLPTGTVARRLAGLWQQRLRVPLPAVAATIALVILSAITSAWLWLSPVQEPRQEVVYIFGMPQIEVYSTAQGSAQ
jgi:anti-sigma factor RsiW